MKLPILRITVAAPESAQEALARVCGDKNSVIATQDFQSRVGASIRIR